METRSKTAGELKICPHMGCQKQFKNNSSYVRHLRTHTSHGFYCEICGIKKYTRTDNRNKHQKKCQGLVKDGCMYKRKLDSKKITGQKVIMIDSLLYYQVLDETKVVCVDEIKNPYDGLVLIKNY